MTTQKTAIEHIDTIIESIESLIDKKEDFVAFILISLGIEYLGSFYDANPFFESGKSGMRFKNGVDLFKDNWYTKNKQWLFKNFRGPLVHQFWTGSEILLTSNCKNKAPLSSHLKLENDKRIFVLEKLFDDFKVAANSLKTLSKRENSLNKEKLNQLYSEILTLNADNVDFACSGTTMTTITNVESVEYVKDRKNKIRKKLKKNGTKGI